MPKLAERNSTNGTPFKRFEWHLSEPDAIAREILRRNAHENSPDVAQQNLLSPCMICEKIVKRGQEFLKSGSNTQRITHYTCIWATLPDEESTALRADFENGQLPVIPESNGNGNGNLARLQPIGDPLSHSSAAGKTSKKAVMTKAKKLTDYNVEEVSLIDLNHRMGSLQAELTAEKRLNEELRKQNDRLVEESAKMNAVCREILMRMLKTGVAMPWDARV